MVKRPVGRPKKEKPRDIIKATALSLSEVEALNRTSQVVGAAIGRPLSISEVIRSAAFATLDKMLSPTGSVQGDSEAFQDMIKRIEDT